MSGRRMRFSKVGSDRMRACAAEDLANVLAWAPPAIHYYGAVTSRPLPKSSMPHTSVHPPTCSVDPLLRTRWTAAIQAGAPPLS